MLVFLLLVGVGSLFILGYALGKARMTCGLVWRWLVVGTRFEKKD
jgi:hypothetical protein